MSIKIINIAHALTIFFDEGWLFEFNPGCPGDFENEINEIY